MLRLFDRAIQKAGLITRIKLLRVAFNSAYRDAHFDCLVRFTNFHFLTT